MLADVYRLRREGVKLDPAAVKASKPVRGDLRFAGYGLREGTFFDAKLKRSSGSGGTSIIPDLVRAELRRIDGQDLLFHGYEKVGDVEHFQAWWCVVVQQET